MPTDTSRRIAEFFKRHYTELLRALLRNRVEESDARDALQNAYLQVSKPGIGFLEKTSPKAYVIKVAVREWLAEQRNLQTLSVADFDAGTELTDAEIAAWDSDPACLDRDEIPDALARTEAVTNAYATLTRDDKRVCNLMIEGLDVDEIVSLTEFTRDQVRRCMTRVKKQLRRVS